ncbi:MAG: thiamine ABC transporter substrate-binding protein [Pelagibacteraceae bacterium]|nr:thiamine ABC transporter substrate-binding protein [Pelagibacteraceae bacterium]
MIKLILLLTLIPMSLLSKEQLNILTYDSFISDWGPGPNIQKSFESRCSCTINWITADSSGALLSRVKLSKNKEGIDILMGLDDSLMSEAKETNLFETHSINSSTLSNLNISWNDEIFLPFDYGFFSFIYNSFNLSNPPTSFDQLAQRNDISIIIMDPRTSTPGLGLAKWIYQLKGDSSNEFWKSLQDQIVITAKSWSDGYGLFLEGEADIVLSYTTSPAYHAIAEGDETYKAMIFEEGHAEQIEVLAILKNSQNKQLADQFMQFSISSGFQNFIPNGNWMYPVIDEVEGIESFYRYAPKPSNLDRIFGSTSDRTTWIKSWSSSIE